MQRLKIGPGHKYIYFIMGDIILSDTLRADSTYRIDADPLVTYFLGVFWGFPKGCMPSKYQSPLSSVFQPDSSFAILSHFVSPRCAGCLHQAWESVGWVPHSGGEKGLRFAMESHSNPASEALA